MTDKKIADINRSAWNKIALKGNVVNPYSVSKKQKEIFNYFVSKLAEGAFVLDLGCGNGLPISLRLSKLGYQVTGVDISDEMIKQAMASVPKGTFF